MIPKRATSRYTLETIEKRLADLRGQQEKTEETDREIQYLEELKERKFSETSAR